MKKLINKNLIFVFIPLAILVLGLFSFSPQKAEARLVRSGASASFDSEDNNGNGNYGDSENSDANSNINSNPIIYSISPTSSTVGANAKLITVAGNNFNRDSIVRFNGSDRETTYLNSSKLTALLTKNDLAQTGSYSISVYNPGNPSKTSNRVYFLVNKAVAKTVVTSSVKKTTTTQKSTSANANQTACASNTITETTEEDSENNSLAAASIFGTGTDGFLPGSFLGWLVMATLVLLIVLVWRKFFYGAKRYHSTPLKHA